VVTADCSAVHLVNLYNLAKEWECEALVDTLSTADHLELCPVQLTPSAERNARKDPGMKLLYILSDDAGKRGYGFSAFILMFLLVQLYPMFRVLAHPDWTGSSGIAALLIVTLPLVLVFVFISSKRQGSFYQSAFFKNFGTAFMYSYIINGFVFHYYFGKIFSFDSASSFGATWTSIPFTIDPPFAHTPATSVGVSQDCFRD